MANTEINGSKITLVWHVANLKVSHKDSFEATRLAAYLTYIHGGLKVNRGKLHDYLGMDLYYTEKIIVKVSMIQYLKILLREFPEHLVTS